LLHKPTGHPGVLTQERSQLQNKERALEISCGAKLLERELAERQQRRVRPGWAPGGAGVIEREDFATYKRQDNRASRHRLHRKFSA